MSLANVSGAVAADGNVLVLAGPAATITNINAPTSTQLKSTGMKDITYDLTASGFVWTTAQDSVPNERFTLNSTLSSPGRKTVTTSLQFVYGSPDDVADPLFVENTNYVIAVRFAVDHDQPIAAADIWDLIIVKAGHKSKDAPAANTELTKTQMLFPQSRAVEDYPLAA